MQAYCFHVFYIDEVCSFNSTFMTVFANTEKEARVMVTVYLEGCGYTRIDINHMWVIDVRKNFFISNFSPRVFKDLFFEKVKEELKNLEKNGDTDETMG